MSQHLSLPKDKIRFLLLEGVHQNAIDTLNAAGYTNIDYRKTALEGEALKEAIKDAHFIGIRSRTQLTEEVFEAANKLIAVGSVQDLNYALKFIETESELLHLSLLCEDAEFYPDLQDELRKTPAIQKRSIQLSRMLMKKGFEPIFLAMDEKQQLIAANAMLRQMAKIADPNDKLEGYRKVANYIEAGEYLTEHKLLQAGMNALTDKVLRLEHLTHQSAFKQ